MVRATRHAMRHAPWSAIAYAVLQTASYASYASLLIAMAACATGGAGGVDGTSGASFGGYGRRDERVRLGSFTSVPAVAVSRRYVYAAGTSGLAVYDRVFNRWLPPLSPGDGPDGALFEQQITLLAGDPTEDALWIGAPGVVSVYRPDTEQLQRTMVVGVPDFIAFDRSGNGDVIVRSGGQFLRISRVGITTPLSGAPALSTLIVPKQLADLYGQFPVLRTQPQIFLRNQLPDRALRPATLLSGTASPDRSSELWLGTDGEGLFRFDPTFLEATALPYGLIDPGVGALAPAADGVWAAGLGVATQTLSPMNAGNRAGARGGLSFVANDLQRFRWIDGTINVPLVGVRSHALATRGAKAWIGTDRGLVRMQLDGRNELRAWTTFDGLPDNRVLAVAPRDEGVWIGTPRGAVFVSDSVTGPSRGVGARWLDNVTVHALLSMGDTLWLGSEAGLVAVEHPMAAGTLLRPADGDPALRRPVRALAWSDSVLLAATDDAVLQIAPRGGRAAFRLDALDPRPVGAVTRVGVDGRTMWVAGADGVLFVSRHDGHARLLRRGIEVSGPVLDVVAGESWWWLGTPQGLVRLRRTSDGLMP